LKGGTPQKESKSNVAFHLAGGSVAWLLVAIWALADLLVLAFALLAVLITAWFWWREGQSKARADSKSGSGSEAR
jgi:Flp pilus assembly protein TadB